MNTHKHIHKFQLVNINSDLCPCLYSTSPCFVFFCFSFPLLSPAINIQLKFHEGGYMNYSNRRFIMRVFLSLSLPSWIMESLPFSRATSKLNAVRCRATQEQTGPTGIYWIALLWPKHLFPPLVCPGPTTFLKCSIMLVCFWRKNDHVKIMRSFKNGLKYRILKRPIKVMIDDVA